MTTKRATALIERARAAPESECPAIFHELFALGVEAREVEVDALALVNVAAKDEPLRALGARALLVVLGNEDAEVHLRTLIERAASGKANERSAAKVYLRDLDGTLVAPALLRALSTHPRAAVRAMAATLAGGTVQVRAAFPVDALIDALADADEKVRVAALTSIQQHLAPSAPAKPSSTMTPARRARLTPLLADPAKAVADVAKRIFARLENS
jgi:HEAT repeat protein